MLLKARPGDTSLLLLLVEPKDSAARPEAGGQEVRPAAGGAGMVHSGAVGLGLAGPREFLSPPWVLLLLALGGKGGGSEERSVMGTGGRGLYVLERPEEERGAGWGWQKSGVGGSGLLYLSLGEEEEEV